MQRDKNTKRVEQIEKISKSPEQITQSIADVIDCFGTKSLFKETDLIKRCGILVSTITMALLILPFLGKAGCMCLIQEWVK